MPDKHPRYPAWFIATAVVALLVAVADISRYDYSGLGDDAWGALALDFAVAWAITFGFWYGVVLGIGWLGRRFSRS